MKKIISIMAILMLMLSGCTNGGNDPAAKKSEGPAKVEEVSLKEETEDYIFDVTYPVVSGFEDDKLQTSLNRNIEGLTSDMTVEIATMAKEDKAAFEKDGFDFNQYYYDSGYSIVRNTSDIFSLRIDTHIYTGGAHGMHELVCFNLDLDSSKELILDDLFKDPEKAKEYMVSDIESKIAEESKKPDSDPEKILYFEDAEVSLDHVPFSIGQDRLEFYFQSYDIAPYASGMPMFSFTFDELSEFLKDKYKTL